MVFGVAICGFLIVAVIFGHGTTWPEEKRQVYAWYNDALVEGDLNLAYSLGCVSDRETVTLERFTALYESALEPLGGQLESWSRLRGAAEWNGSTSSRRSLPVIEQVDGRYCVRLGGNPLGT